MLVLGPNTIKRGLAPATALLGCRGMALLGPAEGESGEVDPISRIFLVVGKIMALRRVLAPEDSGVGSSQITNLKQIDVAQIDQAVSGKAEEYSEWEVVWDPLWRDVANQLPNLQTFTRYTDVQVRKVVMDESVRILGLDPQMADEDRVQAVIDYMRVNGLTIERQHHGMRDHLMRLMRDASGVPAAFPSSAYPTFPDSWITPEVIVPESTARSWVIIL